MASASAADDPLRVMHVVDNLGQGGAQQVVVDLSNWLARQNGIDVTVFGERGSAVDLLERSVRFIPAARSGFLGQTKELLAAAREVRPHVLHAHQRREALQALLVGRALGIPVVEHAHTRLPSVRPRALSFRSRTIFAVGPAVADMIVNEAGRPRELVQIVGNAPAQRQAGAPSAPNDPTSTLRVLAIGRLTEQKDPLRFVRVIARLSRDVAVEATWAGDGELSASARRLARELGAPIHFIGHVDDISARLDEAHCLVMTSRWEGTSLAVLEAFDRRRPVVATVSASNGLLAGGRGFEVADDASDAQFAATIGHLFENDEERMRAIDAAKRWVDAEASPERVFGPVLAAYRRLCDPARRS
jgi:glycosyltransferase involved in cell wall biosynthesis